MSFQVYIDGEYYAKEDAKISVYDHGLLYGDGVFEGMRSYHGVVFRLQAHLDRLWNSAKAIWLEIPLTQEEMADAVNAHAAAKPIAGCLHPPGRDTRRRDPGPRSQSHAESAGDYHHRSHRLVSGRVLRERSGNHYGQHDPQPSGSTQPANQVAELPE